MSALHDQDEALAVAIEGGTGLRGILRDRAEVAYSARWNDRDAFDTIRRDAAIDCALDAALETLWSLKGWDRGTLNRETEKAATEARRVAREETRPVLLAVDGILDALLGTSLYDLRNKALRSALADLLSFFPETAEDVEGLDQ